MKRKFKRPRYPVLTLPKIEYTESVKILLSAATEKWRRYSRRKTEQNYTEYVKSIQDLSNEIGLSLMQCMEIVANRSRSRKRT